MEMNGQKMAPTDSQREIKCKAIGDRIAANSGLQTAWAHGWSVLIITLLFVDCSHCRVDTMLPSGCTVSLVTLSFNPHVCRMSLAQGGAAVAPRLSPRGERAGERERWLRPAEVLQPLPPPPVCPRVCLARMLKEAIPACWTC